MGSQTVPDQHSQGSAFAGAAASAGGGQGLLQSPILSKSAVLPGQAISSSPARATLLLQCVGIAASAACS